MTALRPTHSPIRLPRALRAALLGLAFFSATAGATALANTGNAAPATATGATAQASTATAPLPSGKTAELGLSRWDYKEDAFFKRISEYFSGEENTGYRIILRTDPQQRKGLYFQAPLNVPVRDLPQGAAFQVRFVRPDKADEVVTHTFTIPADLHSSNKSQLWLGFTGADTPADNASPVAWQIRVIDAEGNQLAQTHSFLWSPRDGR